MSAEFGPMLAAFSDCKRREPMLRRGPKRNPIDEGSHASKGFLGVGDRDLLGTRPPATPTTSRSSPASHCVRSLLGLAWH